MDELTAAQIDQLAMAIDRELVALSNVSAAVAQKSLERPDSLLAKQTGAIAQVTQEPAISFLKKFRLAAKRDLCEEGGVLYAQWQKWRDLASRDLVTTISPILALMGFTGAPLQTLTVAIGVIVLHIGLRAFCEDFSE